VIMPHSISAMLLGMLIMVVPAFVICAGIGIMAYRRRAASRKTEMPVRTP
jgi:hypothetical protein